MAFAGDLGPGHGNTDAAKRSYSAQAASFAFRRWAQPVLEGLLDSTKAIPFKTAQRFLGWNQITLLRRVINHQGARGVPFIPLRLQSTGSRRIFSHSL